MSIGYTWVQWSRPKLVYDGVLIGGILLYLAAFVGVSRIVWGGEHASSDEILLIRGFGTLAFVLLHLVLSIGPLARLDRRFLPLLYNRRHLGVATFMVGLVHGLVTLGFYHGFGTVNPLISILSSNTEFDSVTEFPFELFGIAALLILFLMASTSHDFWNRNLGPSFWKWLHMFVYVAYGLLVLHVALGALQKETSPAYVVMLGVGVVMVTGLHLCASLVGRRRDRQAKRTGDDWIDLGAVADIPEARAMVVDPPHGERIAVFRHDGKLSAVASVCRHQGGPLGEGKIIDGCITCPWHGWQYRPEDGQSPPPFQERIETYELRLEGERVLLNPQPNPPGTPVPPVACPVARAAVPDAHADELYVAYLPMSAAQRRFVRTAVPLICTLLFMSGAAIGFFQQDPGTGTWPYGQKTQIEGIVVHEPYAMLLRPEGAHPETILLVGDGKYGAVDQVKAASGSRVRLSGVPISRHGMRLFELWPSDATLATLSANAELPVTEFLGSRTLRGEVIDPKCYFGAMKPAQGKTHKACAILCIRGGIPPMFCAREADGTLAYYLLVDAEGGPANELVIPHVGESVIVVGDAELRSGLKQLRITAESFRPIQ